MAFRKHIGRFLVLTLLAAQIALAQHATVHVLEGGLENGRAGISLQHSAELPADHRHPDKEKACDICLLAGGLSHQFLAAAIALPVAVHETGFAVPDARSGLALSLSLPYQARAPPTFLS